MALILNGSGTIDGVSVGGLPNATVTQAELAPGVAGNGPAFSAYMGANQTVTHITYTKLQFNTKTFDTDLDFDTTTYRFTPSIAGYYNITTTACLSSTTATHAISAFIYKNGVLYKAGCVSTPSTNAFAASVASSIVYCNGSTDYIEAYVYIDVGSGTGVVYALNSSRSDFSGALVRAV